MLRTKRNINELLNSEQSNEEKLLNIKNQIQDLGTPNNKACSQARMTLYKGLEQLDNHIAVTDTLNEIGNKINETKGVTYVS